MPTHRAATQHRAASRFSRSGSSHSASGRRVAAGPLARRKPPESAPKRALHGVSSALPDFAKGLTSGGGTSSKSRSRGKAGGIALATAAAGVAFKYRDKLTSMLHRKGDENGAQAQATPTQDDGAPTEPGSGPAAPPPAAP